jgi:hypothetical protein
MQRSIFVAASTFMTSIHSWFQKMANKGRKTKFKQKGILTQPLLLEKPKAPYTPPRQIYIKMTKT